MIINEIKSLSSVKVVQANYRYYLAQLLFWYFLSTRHNPTKFWLTLGLVKTFLNTISTVKTKTGQNITVLFFVPNL